MFINQDQVTGLARIIVPVGVSYAVGRGWISASGAGDVTAALLTIGASVWTIFAHTNSAKIAAVEALPSVTKIVVDPKAPSDDAAAQAAADHDRPKVSVEPSPASMGMGTRPSVTRDQRL
jgi:hypothetical protein